MQRSRSRKAQAPPQITNLNKGNVMQSQQSNQPTATATAATAPAQPAQPQPIDLLQLLRENGITADGATERTARIYTQPTIEFYKSGGIRLRGCADVLQGRALVYKITPSAILFFTAPTDAAAKSTAAAANCNRYCGADRANPNIKAAQSQTAHFFNHIAATEPQSVQQSGAGGCASAPLQVQQQPDGTALLRYDITAAEPQNTAPAAAEQPQQQQPAQPAQGGANE